MFLSKERKLLTQVTIIGEKLKEYYVNYFLFIE